MKKKLISAIIPCYNEGRIIARSINAVEKELCSLHRPFELLIVDDGSTDATLQTLRKMIGSRKHHNLRFVSYKDGPSRRENLSKSFKLLNGDCILLLDMDLSMDLRHLKEMLYWLDHGYDIVIPNRYHPKSYIKRNPKRYVISKVYNALIRLFFRTGLKDNICGFKAFKRDAAVKLVKQAGIDKTGMRSVFWDTEMLIRALRQGIKIKDIPIHWEDGKNSALTFKREIRMLPYIVKFWFRVHKNRNLP